MHAETSRATIKRFTATRVHLNQGGYDHRGRYWGRTGTPLYRIDDEDTGQALFVRAHTAHAARNAALHNPSYWGGWRENPLSKPAKVGIVGGVIAAAVVVAAVFWPKKADATTGGPQTSDECKGLDANLSPAQCHEIRSALASTDIPTVTQVALHYAQYPIARKLLQDHAAALIGHITPQPNPPPQTSVTIDATMVSNGQIVFLRPGDAVVFHLTPLLNPGYDWTQNVPDPSVVRYITRNKDAFANVTYSYTAQKDGTAQFTAKYADINGQHQLQSFSMNIDVSASNIPGVSATPPAGGGHH